LTQLKKNVNKPPMSELLILDPEKLMRARGPRKRKQIVQAGEGKFSEQQLYGWEKGLFRPRPETLPYLLKALNVSFEQIASPISQKFLQST
jgi:hypothetical protein